MKKLRFSIFLTLALALGACDRVRTGNVQGGDKISMKYDGKEVSFEPKHARFATFKKGLIEKISGIQNKNERVSAVVHRIYLANYDLQLTDAEKQDYRRIASDGQYRVEIQIEADESAVVEAPLKVGEYFYKPTPFNRISYVFLSYAKDGKDSSQNLQAAEFDGKIKITSVTETEVKGEIEVFDQKEFVKGSFTAQKLPN